MTTTKTTPAAPPGPPPPAPPRGPGAPIEHPIIFFDGVCGMCNRFVDLMLRADRKAIFRFAPLQGQTAQQLLPPLPDANVMQPSLPSRPSTPAG